MFTWIEKVIPQPPETPKKAGACEQAQTENAAAPEPKPEVAKANTAAQVSDAKDAATEAADAKIQEAGQSAESDAGKSVAGGVLTWLAQGLGKVVPQPVDSPTFSRASREEADQKQKDQAAQAKKTETPLGQGSADSADSAVGVLSWLAHGLEKVVPQPAWSPKQGHTTAETQETPAQKEKETKIVEAPPVPPPDPAPAPPPAPSVASVQLQPTSAMDSSTSAAAAATDKGTGSGVLSWLRQGIGKVVPQPEVGVEGLKKVEEGTVESTPEIPVRRFSEKEVKGGSMLGWISQGLEKVIPQPVTKQMVQGAETATQCMVEERGKGV